MRNSLENVDFSDKSKTEIKRMVSDWSSDKLLKEALCQSGYSRQSVHNLGDTEMLRYLYANVCMLSVREEKYKNKAVLHKERAKAYREKLKEEGYDPRSVVDNSIDEDDVSEIIYEEIQKLEDEIEA